MHTVELLALSATVVYVIVGVSYKLIQLMNLGDVYKSEKDKNKRNPNQYSVDVIVPTYNEKKDVLLDCVASVCAQDHDGPIKIVIVDDGSADKRGFYAVMEKYIGDDRFTFIELSENRGKRAAQIAAIESTSGELILNVDSDTVIEANVVSRLSAAMEDLSVAGVMGQLVAKNYKQTWLTRIIDMEYWVTCNEERVAQSKFGSVMCCCGPCAMYRRSVVSNLIDKYKTQMFLGKESNFGEDRHMTVLMLQAGFETRYVPDAIARTVVPERLVPYLRQQLRWARSTYRDTFLAMKTVRGMGLYVAFEIFAQWAIQALMTAILFLSFGLAIGGSPVPVIIAAIIMMMSLNKCLLLVMRLSQARFIFFVIHTPINVLLLTPLKLYALMTISDSRWLSRDIKST